MIKALMEAGIFQLLAKDLQITARLRMDHPESSLLDLALLHDPPITKSGVNHRLRKIAESYEKMRKNQEKNEGDGE